MPIVRVQIPEGYSNEVKDRIADGLLFLRGRVSIRAVRGGFGLLAVLRSLERVVALVAGGEDKEQRRHQGGGAGRGHEGQFLHAAGLVHLVWAADRDINYARLDPSLDDRDGSAADPATVIVVTPRLISVDDGNRSWGHSPAMNGHMA